MGTCPTTKIIADNDQGFKIVNTSDVTDTDKVFDESKKSAPKKAASKKKVVDEDSPADS